MAVDSTRPRWGWTFFPIWVGGALSWVGSTIAQFALVWWLTDMTGSVAVLAAATTVALLPQILLGPLAGAYVDRWNRRVIMIVADGLIALLALSLVWLVWQDRLAIWHVYVIMVGRALAGIFHHPAMHAATAMMVPHKELARVQGMNQALGGAVNVIGPALGALAMSLLALHQVMLIDVITAVIAILPLLWARIPEPVGKPSGVGARAIVSDMIEGLRYVRSFPGMLAVIGVAVGLNFVGSPTWTLLPLYVRNVFGGDAGALGMVQSVFGMGLISGGLLLTVWGGFRSRVKTGFGAFVIMGGALVGMGSAPSHMLWALAAGWFVFAFFSAIGNGIFAALLQTTVAPEMQGRVLSVVQSGVQMAIPLGLLLATPAAEVFGLRPLYLAAGVLSAMGSLWAFRSPAIRRLDEVGGQVKQQAPTLTVEPEQVEIR